MPHWEMFNGNSIEKFVLFFRDDCTVSLLGECKIKNTPKLRLKSNL